MTVKLDLINGSTELFETNNFICARKSEMNPDILKVQVYDNSGHRLQKTERHFKWFYKKFLYKPVEQMSEEQKQGTKTAE